MLRVIVTICAALMLASCSGAGTQVESLDRGVSRSYYRFALTQNLPTSTNVYYVWRQNRTWGNYTCFRVIEPIVDIDSYSYTEYIIEGCGPDGKGRYKMRIVSNPDKVKSWTSMFFLVSGF